MSDVTGSIRGMDDLSRKVGLMKIGFEGPEVAKIALKAAREIANQAKRNVRVGPTGLTAQGIIAVAGKKAFKYGAVAVARAKWKGTGAIFEEWGTGDRGPGPWSVMKVPMGKFGVFAGGMTKGGKFKKGAVQTSLGGFGFAFFGHAAPMTGTRFFENAVEEKRPVAAQIIEDGFKEIIAGAVR
jgi:hypothetical protein